MRSDEIHLKITLFRLSSLAAVLAGSLRVLTSVWQPSQGKTVMTLYLIIDVLLLVGCIGLYALPRIGIRALKTVAIASAAVGLLILIARDLVLLSPETYPLGALLFAISLDLFAIASWKSETHPHWLLILLILSTIIGPVGFFSPNLGSLFIVAGILFGVGFAAAGIYSWSVVKNLRSV